MAEAVVGGEVEVMAAAEKAAVEVAEEMAVEKVEVTREVEVEVEVEVVAVDHLTAVTCFFLLRLVSSITTDLESWLGLGLG
tara:strand:+ start:4317 stop:4559 length:243 start_codon:yes stop_codon:yes gene_type:complete